LKTPLTKRQTEVSSSSPRHPSPAVAIFARAPSSGKAKTRLIPLLGGQGAAEFHAALIQDTLRKVDALAGRASLYFFLDGRKFPVPGSRYKLLHQRGADLGARLENAFRRLLRHHPYVVVMGTDSPLLPARVLREALNELRVCDSVLGPCLDGGYYLIGLRQFARGLLASVRWGTSLAFRDTLRNLLRGGYSCSILEPWGDVDVPADVWRLIEQLAHSRGARRLAPMAWRFLKRFQAVR